MEFCWWILVRLPLRFCRVGGWMLLRRLRLECQVKCGRGVSRRGVLSGRERLRCWSFLIVSVSMLRIFFWERGAGVTEACGSGATAAAAAAIDWGIVTGRVRVSMPGGVAEVEVDDENVHLIGPSTFVAEVVLP